MDWLFCYKAGIETGRRSECGDLVIGGNSRAMAEAIKRRETADTMRRCLFEDYLYTMACNDLTDTMEAMDNLIL